MRGRANRGLDGVAGHEKPLRQTGGDVFHDSGSLKAVGAN